MAPVPIYVKGGIWTNLEDQILKAAVQKYGTHAWSKVASLLQKKNARQCQSRWNEFLNPALNFTPFGVKEDEKLLDLAKRIPNQWRTIAEIMGRPAQTCIDRYNILLSVDKDKDGLETQMQVGEINPNNESLPAKEDKKELEDEEREMLAEARARLLNTQGKKATRKIRERMLEESKRIAFLQKRRELKQAGVDSKIKAPKKKYESQLDYNEDIAYEQRPLPGIYDTSKEDERTELLLKKFENLVEQKGVLDRKNNERPKELHKRKQEKQLTPVSIKVSESTNSVLTNEYKKPKLQLSAPKVKSQSKSISKKKSIINLFESLPPPKNDFEIELDDSTDEDGDEDENNNEYGNNINSESEVQTENRLDPAPSDKDHQQIVPKISSITEQARGDDSTDNNFDGGIAGKVVKSPHQNRTLIHEYLESILSSTSAVEVPEFLHPKLEEHLESTSIDTENEIIRMQNRITELRLTLEESVKPERDSISRLSLQLQNTLKPAVSGLAYQYYIDYMKYTRDYHLMAEEKERLEDSLELTKISGDVSV
ncbi:Pre-mRNA-splicing factor CEF1 [Kluyveromyces marxianus]